MGWRGNRLGWIAVVLSAIALVVALGNRSVPQIAVNVPLQAEQVEAFVEQQAREARAEAERSGAAARERGDAWRGEREWGGRHHGEWHRDHGGPWGMWGPWAFLTPLRLLLAIGLIVAGLRLLRRSGRGNPPSGGGAYPGPITQL
jgi:hypothetical protein